MQKHSRISLFITFSLAAGLASGNLITNGSFETGDFTGWTQTPASSGSSFGVSNVVGPNEGPENGNYYAFFNGQSGLYDSISQTLTTVPGQLYLISYWLAFTSATDGTGNDNDFQVFFGGANAGGDNNLDTAPLQPFVFYLENFLFRTATSTSTVLEFKGFDEPGNTIIDNVSVTAFNFAPEPGTFLLAGAGLLGAGLYRAKRSKIARGP